MDDELDVPKKSYPLSPAKMSKTPSWIMLGFVLGVLFVVALPPLRKSEPEPAPKPATVENKEPAPPREPAPLTTIEAVFAEWGDHAVWADGTTQVALWNPQAQGYTDFFEVRRFDHTLYFRSIPSLTRRIISRGKPMPESPLQFTETEEQYQEWRKHGRTERPIDRDTRPQKPEFTSPSSPAISITRPKLEPPATQRMTPPLLDPRPEPGSSPK